MAECFPKLPQSFCPQQQCTRTSFSLHPPQHLVRSVSVRSGAVSPWGDSYFSDNCRPLPPTHGMRVSVFWLEPPVPSSSPFFPTTQSEALSTPCLLFLPSFQLQVCLQPRSSLLILDRGSHVYALLVNPSSCHPRSRSRPVMVGYCSEFFCNFLF